MPGPPVRPASRAYPSYTGSTDLAPEAADPDRVLRAKRSRQAMFERGVALALVVGMLDDVRHLTQLHEGMRWLIQESDLADFERWLRLLREDILRAQRITDREEDE